MKYLKSGIIIVFALLLLSCSNDDGDRVSYGESTGNYLPLHTNNRWKYIFEGYLVNEIKITGTTSAGGYTYYEFTDDSEIPPYVIRHWFAKKGATYFIKVGDTTVNENGVNINFASYELPILKDDYEVNTVWTGSVSPKVTYSGNGFSGSLPFSINYTGINYYKGELTLDGVVYSNVIKTRLDISINADNQITNTSEEYWYAEDIGIIKFITTSPDNVVEEKVIYNYTLN